MQFGTAVAQGEFEAILRDLGHLPMPTLSRLASEGVLLRNGQPWRWEAPEIVEWLSPRPLPAAEVSAAREATHFSLSPSALSSRSEAG